MIEYLFVLYLHTDKPAEIYRWQFENKLACEQAAKFVAQGQGIKSACITDGYGSEVRGEMNLEFPDGALKEGPIEGETP
jgi:hypothetical protein